ncbi:MAG TPA: peptide MFS transporter [Vicinamibacterales bacterium]|nr:peptide MFS transporter [Vicinamibacterales bacterium]
MAVAAAHVAPPGDRAFFGHPRGLSTLFFTEMWERFSYYGMRALLILFMTASPSVGGLGFNTALAGAIYGLYTSSVYMACLPGGWIADRLLGPRRAVLYGGVLIAAGHFSMALQSLATFYLGLVLIVLGTGLLKGNVAVIVGQLYSRDDQRRDAGFSIFYMGINLGAFIAPLVCGYLGQRVGWHIGFGAAGVGMTFGVIQYMLGSRNLGDAGIRPAQTLDANGKRWTSIVALALVVFGAGMFAGVIPIGAKQIADAAGVLLIGGAIVFFAWLFFSSGWTPIEKRRLYAIAALFVAACLFWSQFEQAGSTLNLFGDRASRTDIFGWSFPSSYYQTLQPLFIITFAPIFGWLWLKLGSREPSSPTKFAFGLLLVGAGFALLVPAAMLNATGVKVSPMWLVATYLLHTWGELSLSPVGMSAMTKLAPARITGLIMGVFYLSISIGNFTGGRISSLYGTMPLPTLFGVVGAFGIVAGVIMLFVAPSIKRLMGGVN